MVLVEWVIEVDFGFGECFGGVEVLVDDVDDCDGFVVEL